MKFGICQKVYCRALNRWIEESMNTSQKCNCCIKESVCKYKVEYEQDCENLKQSIIGRTTEISIKCKEFSPKQSTFIREV